MGVLHSFLLNHVKYANMEGFCRDSHIMPFNAKVPKHEDISHVVEVFLKAFVC